MTADVFWKKPLSIILVDGKKRVLSWFDLIKYFFLPLYLVFGGKKNSLMFLDSNYLNVITEIHKLHIHVT